ncbi:MAG: 3'-5' exonuclease, partial [Spirochaetia bacterium]|nr:3'-5' exonuclease [Spirochaetia bacterium]
GAPLWSRILSDKTETAGREERWKPSRAWALPPGAERLPPPVHTSPDCPLPCDWERRRYCAIDVETTGLDPRNDRVLEIGVQLFSFDPEGALVREDSWSSLINPAMSIPAASTAIHGITDLEVSSAPYFSQVTDMLSSLIGSRVAVAHNAGFDTGFIDAEYARLGLDSPFAEVADSLLLLRQANPNLLSYSLDKAAFVLGIERGRSHRALDDAVTCMMLFAYCGRTMAGACP